MSLKIFSGEKRGLKLHLPKNPTFRPTQAKVKEAIFSMLSETELGAKVLDLYAGTGSMGLEAISRGANSALFLDSSEEALSIIKKNISLFPHKELNAILAKLPGECFQLNFYGPFSLIFMDPPYELELSPGENLSLLAKFNVLMESAVLVWEMSSTTLKALDPQIYSPWELFKQRAWGNKAAAFFRYNP
jgi:16S rRNA (guanine(966)-N(2))-methyltransferase RsmD